MESIDEKNKIHIDEAHYFVAHNGDTLIDGFFDAKSCVHHNSNSVLPNHNHDNKLKVNIHGD
jgi:hypothetical protein